tara:strand:- start:30708 stop:31028 length:321 start_codon:yes stop_codon:yes gene_type:complete
MDMLLYQEKATRTLNQTLGMQESLTNLCMGIAGESGELIDYFKKHIFHGHELNREHVKSELGDILWYVACLADTLEISLEDVCLSNIEKLESRYPEGFSKEMSKNR